MSASESEYAIAQLRAANYTPAEIAGMTKAPLHSVMKACNKPIVRALVAEFRAQRLRPLLDQAESEVQSSIKTLAEIRDDELAKNGDRSRAAIALLDWFVKMHEAVDVLPRLAAIEAKLAQSPDDRAIPLGAPLTMIDVPLGLVADDILTASA